MQVEANVAYAKQQIPLYQCSGDDRGARGKDPTSPITEGEATLPWDDLWRDGPASQKGPSFEGGGPSAYFKRPNSLEPLPQTPSGNSDGPHTDGHKRPKDDWYLDTNAQKTPVVDDDCFKARSRQYQV